MVANALEVNRASDAGTLGKGGDQPTGAQNEVQSAWQKGNLPSDGQTAQEQAKADQVFGQLELHDDSAKPAANGQSQATEQIQSPAQQKGSGFDAWWHGAVDSVETKATNLENTVETTAAGLEQAAETKATNLGNAVKTTETDLKDTVETKADGIEKTVETKASDLDDTAKTTETELKDTVETKAAGLEKTVETKENSLENAAKADVTSAVKTAGQDLDAAGQFAYNVGDIGLQVVKGTGDTAKQLGIKIVDGVEKAGEWAVEHPKTAIAIGAAVAAAVTVEVATGGLATPVIMAAVTPLLPFAEGLGIAYTAYSVGKAGYEVGEHGEIGTIMDQQQLDKTAAGQAKVDQAKQQLAQDTGQAGFYVATMGLGMGVRAVRAAVGATDATTVAGAVTSTTGDVGPVVDGGAGALPSPVEAPAVQVPAADAPAPQVVPPADAPAPQAVPSAEAPEPVPQVVPPAEAPKLAPQVAPSADAPEPAPQVAPPAEAPELTPQAAPPAEAPEPAPQAAPPADATAQAPQAAPPADAKAPDSQAAPPADAPASAPEAQTTPPTDSQPSSGNEPPPPSQSPVPPKEAAAAKPKAGSPGKAMNVVHKAVLSVKQHGILVPVHNPSQKPDIGPDVDTRHGGNVVSESNQ